MQILLSSYIRFWLERRPSRFVKKSFVTRACKFKFKPVENDFNSVKPINVTELQMLLLTVYKLVLLCNELSNEEHGPTYKQGWTIYPLNLI